MGALQIIEVEPVYGYGWLVSGKARREVPAIFRLSLEHAEPRLWIGTVLNEGHEFQGRRVTLTQRHLEWSGYVNIEVDADRPTSGSGRVDLTLPPNS